jgi:putative FmdB family regulatory protein
MPYYDLICDTCGKSCTIKASVQARSERTLTCPDCGSIELSTVYRSVNVLRFHNKDCDVCPGASRSQSSAGPSCCSGGCAHSR